VTKGDQLEGTTFHNLSSQLIDKAGQGGTMKTINNAAVQGTSRSNGVKGKPVVSSKREQGRYLSRLKSLAGSTSHYRICRKSNSSSSNILGSNVQVPLPVLPPITVSHGKSGVVISDRVSAIPEQYSSISGQQSSEVQLLMDIHNIFQAKKASKIRTKNLIDMLCKNKLWATFCSGRCINARRLSTMLGEFGIHSKDIRFKSGVFKGFYRKSIAKAFRHLKSV
jgi:hypothetical protein